MLRFAPEERITIEQALARPYTQQYHCPSDEPTSAHFVFPCDGDITLFPRHRSGSESYCRGEAV